MFRSREFIIENLFDRIDDVHVGLRVGYQTDVDVNDPGCSFYGVDNNHNDRQMVHKIVFLLLFQIDYAKKYEALSQKHLPNIIKCCAIFVILFFFFFFSQ